MRARQPIAAGGDPQGTRASRLLSLRGAVLVALQLFLLLGIASAWCTCANADAAEEEKPKRQVRWYVDRGLNIEIRRFGLLEEITATASELLLHVQAGFRMSADGAAYAGDDQDSEPGGLRRAYVRLGGEFWPWRRPIKFYIEIGVINRTFSLDQTYLTFPALPYIGDLYVGQLDPPMSIDSLSSSFARPFMEKSLAVNALVPSSKGGVLLANRTDSQDVTWSIGWFADGTQTQNGENNKSPTRVSGRLTWLASTANDDALPLLHLGAFGSYMYSSNKQIGYNTRPESNWAPTLFDTGAIDGRDSIILGNEVAAARDAWSVQAEVLVAQVRGASTGSADFYGGYVFGTWSLTGEPRPYDRTSGRFGAVTPDQPVAWGTHNLGAWEAAMRISYLDLVDGGVRGGRGIEAMPGLNWYLCPTLRMQLNYGFSHVQDGPHDGNLHIVQTRVDLAL